MRIAPLPLLCLLALAAAATPAAARPGDLDRSFGREGVRVTPFEAGGIGEMVRLSDGSLIVATPGERVTLARLLPDGRLDSFFGSGGRAATGVEGFSFALAVDPGRRILVAGRGRSESHEDRPPFTVERYTQDGLPDPSFGSGGRVEIPVGTSAPNFGPYEVLTAMELQRDGRILVGGHSYSPRGTFFVLARLLSDGRLDPAFGDDGVALTRLSAPSFEAAPNDLILRRDGRILAIGYQQHDDTSVPYRSARTRGLIARFHPDGRLDRDFGRRGRTVLVNPDDGGAFVGSVAAPGARVIALQQPEPAHLATSFVLRAFTRGGAVNRSFGRRGRARVAIAEVSPDPEDGWRLRPSAIARQPDGKLLATGSLVACSGGGRGPCSSWIVLARFARDGRPDREFGGRGYVITKAGDPESSFYGSEPTYFATAEALVLPGDEHPLVGGGTAQDGEFGLMVARYTDSVAPRTASLSGPLDVTRGRVRLALPCREAGPSCAVRLSLRARRPGFAVASGLFRLEPGATTAVELRVSRRARRAVRRAGRLAVTVRLRLRDANGNSSTRLHRMFLTR